MLPLIPLAISVAPEIAKWLFGSTAGKVTESVAQAVQTVTGVADATTSDGAEAAQMVLTGKPELAVQLRVQLAQIAAQQEQAGRQADLEALKAGLSDVADARAQTVRLAQAGSRISYGAPLVSALVLLAFGGVMGLALTRSLPPGSETILNMLLGTLAAMTSSVVSYWVGSSAGSAAKDERLHEMAARSVPATPAG